MAWSPQARREALDLAAELGVREAARRSGVPYRTLYEWVDAEGGVSHVRDSAAVAEQAKTQELLQRRLLDVASEMLDVVQVSLRRAVETEDARDVLALAKAADLLAGRLLSQQPAKQNAAVWQPPVVDASVSDPAVPVPLDGVVEIPAVLIDPDHPDHAES